MIKFLNSLELKTVYGDVENDGKPAYLAELSRIYHDNPLPCVIGGISILLGTTLIKTIPLIMIIRVLFSML